MGRPRTDIGTSGKVSLVGQVNVDGKWRTAADGTRPTRYRARTKFRDDDGVVRDVERFAQTKTKAEAALKRALIDRKAPVQASELRADMTVVAAGELWLAKVRREDSGLSSRTRVQYEGSFDRYFRGSSVQGLTLREVNRVGVIEKFLQRVADERGTASAKSARSVLSNILSEAVRLGVLEFNACREVRPAKANEVKLRERDTTRAFTRAERDAFLAALAADERAQSLDVVDIGYFMAGTGVRISEALGQHWADVDLKLGTVRVRGTKTKASDRTIHLPVWLVERLTERAADGDASGLVFPSPRLVDKGKVRELRNVQRELRRTLDAAGFGWATPHTFRRTVATDIDAAGLPIALAANVLGHADPSMTQRVYLSRKSSNAAAAAVL